MVNYLVGGCALPLWKMMEFVTWDDDIPNKWKVIKFMFQTTNQQTHGASDDLDGRSTGIANPAIGLHQRLGCLVGCHGQNLGQVSLSGDHHPSINSDLYPDYQDSMWDRWPDRIFHILNMAHIYKPEHQSFHGFVFFETFSSIC